MQPELTLDPARTSIQAAAPSLRTASRVHVSLLVRTRLSYKGEKARASGLRFARMVVTKSELSNSRDPRDPPRKGGNERRRADRECNGRRATRYRRERRINQATMSGTGTEVMTGNVCAEMQTLPTEGVDGSREEEEEGYTEEEEAQLHSDQLRG